MFKQDLSRHFIKNLKFSCICFYIALSKLEHKFFGTSFVTNCVSISFQDDIGCVHIMISTLPVKMFGLGQKVLSHLAWSKFWPILANQETLAILHENEAKKKIIFFEKKISKWPTEKKLIFQNRQFSKFFRENFTDWSLG